VENLTTFRDIGSSKELWAHVDTGFSNRSTGSTAMNADSSRSHLLLMIKINVQIGGKELSGKLILVDLAGSERLKLSNVEGEKMKEAIEINKSLTALGNVMESVSSSTGTAKELIGCRDHILTQLLQDSLGGSAKTLMFANISGSSLNEAETIMTCRWASRAKQVVNIARSGKASPVKGSPRSPRRI